MNNAQRIHAKMARPSFFGKITKPAIAENILSKAPVIISTCQALLMSSSNDETRKSIEDIILLTAAIVQTLEAKSDDNKQAIMELCEELQAKSLCLPTVIRPEKSLSSTSYSIAIACLYLLALSVSIAIGATFGAAYFGYLSTGYFTDMLVVALSAIGIPATCLGLLSYAIHTGADNSTAEVSTLGNDIDAFCDEVLQDLDAKIVQTI